MPRTDFKKLLNLKVPHPPLLVQKRITATLDAQLDAAARARAAVATRHTDTTQLIQRWIDDTFIAPKDRRYTVKLLGDEATIQAGVTLGKDYSQHETINVPYLRVANVKDGRLDLSEIKTIDVPDKIAKTLALQYGDLLLTEGGDPDKVGRGTLWQNELTLCIHQNHIFRVRFDLSRFDSMFLALQFRSAHAKAYFLKHAKKTTGIASINQKVLKAYPLIFPSLAEQQAIVATYKKLETHYLKLASALKEQLDALDKLPATLLRQAFGSSN